jgi:APA family basic amino acid/polyamine antiporter
MEKHDSEKMLRKEISFLGLVAIFVGMNIGGALFTLTNVAADITGPSLPLAMLISSIPCLLALVPYSMFSTAWPTTLATYRYSQFLSPPLAFIHMFTLLLCMLIGAQPLFAFTFGKYFCELVPTCLSPAWIGVIVFTLFYIINILGIKFTARIQIILFLAMMVALVLYVILGIPHVEAKNFSPLFPNGAMNFIGAVGMLFTFCAGGLFTIDLGGEVISGNKRYKSGLFLGMITVIVIYLLIHIVTVGSIPWDSLKEKETLIVVASGFMSKGLVDFFIICGALVACATTINVIFTIISRGFLIISGEGIFPSFMGKVSKRFATPHWGLTVAYVLCSASLLYLTSEHATWIAEKPLVLFGAMTNFGLIFPITVVCLAGAIVPFKIAAVYKKSSLKISKGLVSLVSWITVVINTLVFSLLCFLMIKFDMSFTVVMFFSFVVISIIFYYIRISMLKARGKKVPGKPSIK